MVCIGRKLIGARSMLAFNFLMITDAFTRDITEMNDKPVSFDINVRGTVRTWEPHYMIAHSDGLREIVMVHTVAWLMGKSDAYAAYKRDLVDAMADAASHAGFGFRLVTDEQVYVQPRLANAKLLRRHLPTFGTPEGHVAALEALNVLPSKSSVADLQARLGRRFDAFVLSLQLDWLGHLRLDRRTAFSRASTFVKV